MTKNHILKIEIMLVGMGIMIFLISGVQAVDVVTAASKEGVVSNPSGPDCSYCTSTGDICTSTAGVNNGKPICQFSIANGVMLMPTSSAIATHPTRL
jgi:hypothetical protein